MADLSFPEWAKCLFLPSRYKAIYGGRGSSKSHSAAGALLTIGAGAPKRILCAREIQLSIKQSVKKLLDDKTRSMGLDGFYKSLDTEIRGRNGTQFVFTGLRSNIDSVKSMEGFDYCWIEEAQTVSQKSLNTLIPTIRAEGSEIWATWNPTNETDPIDKMFRSPGGAPPGSIVREVNYTENPWFPEVLLNDLKHDFQMDPENALHVWKGHYRKRSKASVFSDWRVEEFETPENVDRFYLGADWGFSVDPTVLVRCFFWEGALFIDWEAYKVGCEVDNTPALFNTVPGASKWPIVADSARPETISLMRRAGFDIKGAKKGPGSIEDGLEFLKSYPLVIHPRCENVVHEVGVYKYKEDPLTGEVLPILEDKDNHTIDALRYAVEGLTRAKKRGGDHHLALGGENMGSFLMQ